MLHMCLWSCEGQYPTILDLVLANAPLASQILNTKLIVRSDIKALNPVILKTRTDNYVLKVGVHIPQIDQNLHHIV